MTETRILPSDAKFTGTGDLARLAFASAPAWIGEGTMAPRHLAFLPPEALDLDLNDPAQRDFGNYELLEKIGQGGMGVVYRARQKSLDREVALKLLAAGPWASTTFIARFQREAQSAARMEHPNIVTVYETGAYEDLNYFSMRLVRGRSLAARLSQDGPYACLDAARLMRIVAEAVDYAHSLDVLHLDLKPGNVLLDEHGDPLVADFGLARRLDQVVAEHNDEVSGTPSYMAPEQAQARSQNIGAATDIYGLGAILYEVLAGHPPFLADTPQETLRRVVMAQPETLRSRRGDIPVDLEAICSKCMVKDPKARYQTARAVADDLGRFLDGREVSVRPLSRFERIGRWARREPRMAIAAAALFASLVAGVTATSLQWRRAEANAQSSRELLWEGRNDAALRLQQDGHGFEALPKLLDNLGEQERADKTGKAALERRRIGILFGQGATLIDRMAIADANPMSAVISPDGSRLALSCNDLSVRWYDTKSLTEIGRVSLADKTSPIGQRVPVFLLRFSGEHRLRATLEWYSNRVSPEDDDTWLIDLDRKAIVEPPGQFADFADASFSADGTHALLRNRHGQAQLWQVAPWRPLSTLGPAQTEFLPVLLDPGLRFVFTLGTAMRPLLVYRPPNLAVPETIALPGNSGVSAWALSGDGKILALGDFEGRVFLMDTATLHLRTLPIARGREITWIDFSEDNAWLAAASFDGSVHAFDVATGDSLVAGEMNHDFDVQHVGLSHQHRLLIASGEGRTALWRLPLPGSRAVPAQRIGLAPAAHGLVGGPYSVGWSAATGMFASAGLDGQVRLWRLPDSPLRPARSARQFPDRTDFDGHKLVDVEWDRIRIVSTRDDALTPWLKLPQPPGFAELFDRGRSLLVTTGAQLRVYDPADLHLRFAPVVLANSPQRLLVSPNGRRLLMSFGAHGPDGFLEQLELFDAATGARLPGMAEIRGPLRHIAFSADGARVLAVGPADGGTQVLSGSDLHVIGDYPNDPTQPAVWADFAPAGDEVVMVTRATDARVGGDQLLYWRPSSERARTIDLPARIRPLGVLATTDGAFVAGSDQDAFATSGVVRPVERLARSEPLAVVAANPNRNLVARAFRREIQLYDAGTGALIGPPLASDSLAMDTIVQLAFSPDGNHLLARTVQGHWLIWSVASEPRKTDELVKSLQYLSVSGENQHAVWVPGPGERATLRANDPGAWHPPDPRPTTAMAGNARPGVGIPAGLTGTSPVMLDLAPFYDFPPEESRNSFYNIRPTMRPLPTGVVSVAGTDFDVRGMMQVGAKSGTAGPANPSLSIRCLPLPRVPVAAIHLLLTASEPDALPTGSAIATLTLHYIDGGSEAIPIRAGQELRGFSGHDQGVPLAFAPDPVLALYGYENDVFAVPRLANPFPGRLASCLDLQATTAEGVLLLMGITVEPTAAAAPVISSAR